MLLPKVVHSSWNSFITEEILAELKMIESEIGNNYNPRDPDKILRFLSIDIKNVKVIWLGQDVYPAKGVATGRSFEVGGLNDWSQPFRQVSLKNIVRLIHKNYTGISSYNEIRKFSEIQKEIKNGTFPIKPPNNLFDSLEDQGVLFLNTSFTCEIGKANSHKMIWRAFSKKVLNYISTQNPNIKWFLWGKEAISTKENIPEGVFCESRHPMMCSEKYQDDFLKFEGFKVTMSEINWLG